VPVRPEQGEANLPVIALLSDFGTRDGYVGVMKGVIAVIAPQVRCLDLTHEIPPQDIAAGRFVLATTLPYFPRGTICVAVVDPGVGTARRGVAIATETGLLVGPDNGLFGAVSGQVAAVELRESRYWRCPQPSATFHGRDVFAPVGAHLARGVSLEALGPAVPLSELATLPLPRLELAATSARGCVQYVDWFGNLATNIPVEEIPRPVGAWRVRTGGCDIPSVRTYGDRVGELVALAGSHGFVEIAVTGGSARARLEAECGLPVTVFWS